MLRTLPSPAASRNRSAARARWPPVSTTTAGPSASTALTSASASCCSCASPGGPASRPASTRASGRFGVRTVARGRISSISARSAPGSSSRAPDSATITGSTTTGVPSGSPSIACATASTVSTVPSIPTFTASTPMSSTTARTCASTISGGMAWIALTPIVLCTVTAVIALMPCTPQRANAFRSAWMPAPPPESEPAIVSARGVRAGSRLLTVRSVARAPGAIASGRSARRGRGVWRRCRTRTFARREDRVAPRSRHEQASVLVAHLGFHDADRAVAPIELGPADDLPLGGRLQVVDRDVDRRDALLLAGLHPQGRAHAIVDERIGDHAREQAAAVDQLGTDLQPDRLRIVPDHPDEAAHAVERARPTALPPRSGRAVGGLLADVEALRDVPHGPEATRAKALHACPPRATRR